MEDCIPAREAPVQGGVPERCTHPYRRVGRIPGAARFACARKEKGHV